MMHIVFFSPEDLSIIKEGPAGRRRFLDMELSQIDKGYMQQLVAYNKILNERNNLLKQINLYPALIDTLDGWDEQLLAAGQFLIKKREEFVYFLDEMMAKIHGQLTGGKAVSYTHLITAGLLLKIPRKPLLPSSTTSYCNLSLLIPSSRVAAVIASSTVFALNSLTSTTSYLPWYVHVPSHTEIPDKPFYQFLQAC